LVDTHCRGVFAVGPRDGGKATVSFGSASGTRQEKREDERNGCEHEGPPSRWGWAGAVVRRRIEGRKRVVDEREQSTNSAGAG